MHCDVNVDVDAGVYEITILGIFTTINSPFESILEKKTPPSSLFYKKKTPLSGLFYKKKMPKTDKLDALDAAMTTILTTNLDN